MGAGNTGSSRDLVQHDALIHPFAHQLDRVAHAEIPDRRRAAGEGSPVGNPLPGLVKAFLGQAIEIPADEVVIGIFEQRSRDLEYQAPDRFRHLYGISSEAQRGAGVAACLKEPEGGDVEGEVERRLVGMRTDIVVRLPGADGDALARNEWIIYLINLDRTGRSLDVENQMTFPVRVQGHWPVEVVKRDPPKGPMMHCERSTHRLHLSFRLVKVRQGGKPVVL